MLTATEVFDTARTLLNDDGAELWTDTVLLKKLKQAHRELQVKLRLASVPIMKKLSAGISVSSGTFSISSGGDLPADLIEPIRLWECSAVEDFSSAVEMTESDPLPNISIDTTLNYWQWDGVNINLTGASATRKVFIHYWRTIAIPSAGGNSIGIPDGELYLAPRVAAIAAGSVGQGEVYSACTDMANTGLENLISSLRGRGTPQSGGTPRP